MIADSPTRGGLVELVKPREGELEPLHARQLLEPRTIGDRPLIAADASEPFSVGHCPPGPMLVRGLSSATVCGYVVGLERAGRPAIELSVFLHPDLATPGIGVEAYLLYARRLMADGKRTFRITVLGGDTIGRRMLERLGLTAQARLREHVWSGGTFHDVFVYVIDQATFASVDVRARALLGRRAGVPG